MRHIILGGNGFVGRHLAQSLLARNEPVVVCDIKRDDLPIYRRGVRFIEVDITDAAAVGDLPLEQTDVVYNLAARLLVPIKPRRERYDFFWSVNHGGTVNILDAMERKGCRLLIYFTTDMVYGHSAYTPRDEDHPRVPLGPYGASKFASEELCEEYRGKGFRITIFRPRLIIGPGRLGILKSLFRFIELGLPVPLIGSGRNYYQFVSVFDCVSAILAAVDRGIPNREYNLGSADPPTVQALLRALIEAAHSRSVLLPTPAKLTKTALAMMDRLGKPLLDPEQYLIADETCVLDISRAAAELGWVPQHRDAEMLIAAYREYAERASTEMAAEVPN